MKETQIAVRIFLCSNRPFFKYLLKSLVLRRLVAFRVLLTAVRSQLFHRQEGACKLIRLSRCHE